MPSIRRDELAIVLGVDPDYYTDLERGRLEEPVPSDLEDRIAQALHLDGEHREELATRLRAVYEIGPASPSTPGRTAGRHRLAPDSPETAAAPASPYPGPVHAEPIEHAGPAAPPTTPGPAAPAPAAPAAVGPDSSAAPQPTTYGILPSEDAEPRLPRTQAPGMPLAHQDPPGTGSAPQAEAQPVPEALAPLSPDSGPPTARPPAASPPAGAGAPAQEAQAFSRIGSPPGAPPQAASAPSAAPPDSWSQPLTSPLTAPLAPPSTAPPASAPTGSRPGAMAASSADAPTGSLSRTLPGPLSEPLPDPLSIPLPAPLPARSSPSSGEAPTQTLPASPAEAAGPAGPDEPSEPALPPLAGSTARGPGNAAEPGSDPSPKSPGPTDPPPSQQRSRAASPHPPGTEPRASSPGSSARPLPPWPRLSTQDDSAPTTAEPRSGGPGAGHSAWDHIPAIHQPSHPGPASLGDPQARAPQGRAPQGNRPQAELWTEPRTEARTGQQAPLIGYPTTDTGQQPQAAARPTGQPQAGRPPAHPPQAGPQAQSEPSSRPRPGTGAWPSMPEPDRAPTDPGPATETWQSSNHWPGIRPSALAAFPALSRPGAAPAQPPRWTSPASPTQASPASAPALQPAHHSPAKPQSSQAPSSPAAPDQASSGPDPADAGPSIPRAFSQVTSHIEPVRAQGGAAAVPHPPWAAAGPQVPPSTPPTPGSPRIPSTANTGAAGTDTAGSSSGGATSPAPAAQVHSLAVPSQPRAQSPRPELAQFLETFDMPALLRSRTMDILAANRTGSLLYAPVLQWEGRHGQYVNLLEFALVGSGAAMEFWPDWQLIVDVALGELGRVAQEHPHDPEVISTVGALMTSSRAFGRMWSAATPRRLDNEGIETVRHPMLGVVELPYRILYMDDEGHHVVVYAPVPGSSAHTAMKQLSTWGVAH